MPAPFLIRTVGTQRFLINADDHYRAVGGGRALYPTGQKDAIPPGACVHRALGFHPVHGRSHGFSAAAGGQQQRQRHVFSRRFKIHDRFILASFYNRTPGIARRFQGRGAEESGERILVGEISL